MADEKKGITVKIDADLHAEVRQYLEQHGMTMAEFVTQALDDELHPKHTIKEEKDMSNTRTIAFQVPEELFQRIKEYLSRNNITQRQFVIGLIETELDREQTQRASVIEEAPAEEAADLTEAADAPEEDLESGEAVKPEETLEEGTSLEAEDAPDPEEGLELDEAPDYDGGMVMTM